MSDSLTHDELMRYLDGELSPDARDRVERAVSGSTELQRELAIFRAMQSDLRELSFSVDPGRSLWDQVSRRITQPVGWALLISGTVIYVVYGAWLFATSPVDLWEKLTIGAIVIGFLILLGNTIWERVREFATDPYRDIQR